MNIHRKRRKTNRQSPLQDTIHTSTCVMRRGWAKNQHAQHSDYRTNLCATAPSVTSETARMHTHWQQSMMSTSAVSYAGIGKTLERKAMQLRDSDSYCSLPLAHGLSANLQSCKFRWSEPPKALRRNIPKARASSTWHASVPALAGIQD